MKQTPIDYEIVKRNIAESKLPSIGKASIREIKKLVDNIEVDTGQKFIRMEMGVPGLPPTQIGVEAEIEALKKGVASIYPDIHIVSRQSARCREDLPPLSPLTGCMKKKIRRCLSIPVFRYINNN
jgi:hypothetical protein